MHHSPTADSHLRFKEAAAEGALFELRLRLLAGTTPAGESLPIDTKLAAVKDVVLSDPQALFSDEQVRLVGKAVTIRNKLLHCEFSSVRAKLDELSPKQRDGGVHSVPVAGLNLEELASRISAFNAHEDVGQTSISSTKTKTLADVYAWVMECDAADEFTEAKDVFLSAMAALDLALRNRALRQNDA